MTQIGDSQSLFQLGKRLERLLFFGILLLATCFIEAYLATAATSVAQDRLASGLHQIASRLESQEAKLEVLFGAKASPRAKENGKRKRLVAETRRKLGLPPAATASTSPEGPTYVTMLRDILRDASLGTPMQSAELATYLDASQPPRPLIDRIRQKIAEIESKPVKVWGIETPRLVPVQYGKLDYKIPAEVLAATIVFALAPLIVGWLGSVYVTRQRELLIIASIDDYKLAFPHVLNLLPVVFDRVKSDIGVQQKPGIRTLQIRFNRIALAITRNFVILAFAIPMVGAFAYSVAMIWAFQDFGVSFGAGIGLIFTVVMLAQSLSLLIQEWVVLLGKSFYE